jgi:hypothetical protein
MLTTLYQSIYIYYTVLMWRGTPLCPRDNILFFIFSFFICEFAGTCARREGTLLAVKSRDRRSSLRPDVPARHQRARRGRPQVWKEIVEP